MIRCTSRQLSKQKYSSGLVSLYFPSKSIPYTKFESILLAMRYSKQLGGCPFHGRVERDEIPTRESPPKQSGTR